MTMKKFLTLFCAAAALITGLCGCDQKQDQPIDGADLRYRVADSYALDAISPKAFTIVVKSTKPWTVTSKHPDWCIIDIEKGEAELDSLVHIGKGQNTTIRVQYYDNTDLDDRTDFIVIQSNGWVGKTVTVNQKGIAYMNVPESEVEEGILVEKAGGNLLINVKSNQNWSAKISKITGDWLSITEGATGSMDGEIKLSAKENTGEKRYATVTVFDRHDVKMYDVAITQDGVQLDPETFEVRAGFDQTSATLSVVANAKWTAEKGGEEWFSIDNPTGHDGNDVLNITFSKNAGTALRKGSITLKTVPANAGDAVAEKEIVIKQAYEISPVRHMMDSDEISLWKSDWANAPVYTKDVGTLFTAKCRLNQGSMPFGTYTFRWSNIAGGARVRHWFCYSESCEMKFDVRPVDGKCSFDFNVAGDGNKPSLDGFTDLDFSQPVEITYKFDPSGSEYCHITYLVNGKVAATFDTSESLLRTVTWGAKINMYIGCDQVTDQPTGSAVLEWYDYTAPMDWGD